MGLRIFLRNWKNFATKRELEIVLEDFCRIAMILRLRQNLDLSWNNFLELELDLEYFCPQRRGRRGIGLGNFLYKKAKGRRGVGLRINCPSKKGEGE